MLESRNLKRWRLSRTMGQCQAQAAAARAVAGDGGLQLRRLAPKHEVIAGAGDGGVEQGAVE